MSEASKHKAFGRSKVKLSTGVEIIVRRLKPFDFLSTGTIPDVIFSASEEEKEKRVDVLKNKNVLMDMYKVALIRGVIPTAEFIPVDKPQTDQESNEVCLSDFTE